MLTFHKNIHSVAQDPDGCEQNEDGKDEGADGISQFVFWTEVDDDGSNQHTQTLDKVTYDVNESSFNVNIGAVVAVASASTVAVSVALMKAASHSKQRQSQQQSH